MRLLIADDEKELTSALKMYFSHHNYVVDVADNGRKALEQAMSGIYDGIILDIMMPYMDGLQVLQTMRDNDVQTPVLLLSAKGELEDRVAGLDMGADDYLPKPFAMKELMARVRAMTRRNTVLVSDQPEFGGMRLNRELSRLEYGEHVIHLPSKEFQLMEILMRNPGILISSEQIMERIWGSGTDTEMNIICVYITYLRRKISSLGAPVEIRSSRGIGYQLVECEKN
ncbi:MAG: response regulator transcription factor [Lachnospiraceae bacterium]|nr:response regulator transcription factor [Lachnospiraceae bacterium]